MLLKTFKSNQTANFLLIPTAALLFWLKSIISTQTYPFYPGESDNLLFKPLYNLLAGLPLLQVILTFLLFIILAILMLQFNNRYNLLRRRTMLPAPLFIVMVSGFTGLQMLHPVYFGALFLLFAILRLFSAFDKIRCYSAAFDSGFFLAIGSLFYFNLIVLFPAFFLGIGILTRETRWREFAVFLTGFLLPFIFAFSYLFFTGNTDAYLHTLEMNILTTNNHFTDNLPQKIYVGFLVFITLLGSADIIRNYDTKKVSTRKFFMVFFLIFLFSLAGLLLIPATSHEMLVITIIPLTFLSSNFFVFMKKRFWGELWFTLLFIFAMTMQFLR